MTDKELLELAAKAIGWEITKLDELTGWFYICTYPEPQEWELWNPLTDNGDRYGLARQLGITLNFSNCFASKHVSDSEEILKKWKFGDKEGEGRAILEVAAEILKGVQT